MASSAHLRFAITLSSGSTLGIAELPEGGHVLLDVVADRRLGSLDGPLNGFVLGDEPSRSLVIGGVAPTGCHRVELELPKEHATLLVRNGVWMTFPLVLDGGLSCVASFRDAQGAEILRRAADEGMDALRSIGPLAPPAADAPSAGPGWTAYAPVRSAR